MFISYFVSFLLAHYWNDRLCSVEQIGESILLLLYHGVNSFAELFPYSFLMCTLFTLFRALSSYLLEKNDIKIKRIKTWRWHVLGLLIIIPFYVLS